MVIINGRIFSMEGEIIECGYVRIRGKYIDAIGDMVELGDIEEKEQF